MTSSAAQLPSTARARLAGSRAAEAFRRLRCCRLCAWECGTDRLKSPGAHCHTGVQTRCFIAQTEVADELELIPCFAVALSGCNMRCSFCITGAQSWDASAGDPMNLKNLARHAEHALNTGARSIMILGGEPAIHLPHVLALAAALPQSAPLALKTNGYFSAETQELLDGIFDVLVPDYKFGNDGCAKRLSGVPNYTSVLKETLHWARTQRGLIVRHILMPGHLDCCWKPIASWLAENMRDVKVSLRTGFWPAWEASRHPELLGAAQAEAAIEYGEKAGLTLVQ